MSEAFHESLLTSVPLRDLGLTIRGTALEPLIEQVRGELRERGLVRLEPHFYLSTEWGVPFQTISVAIPFYLASPELTELHAERVGHVEGLGAADILRYLRHELGHVVNYAYRLYDDSDWVELFGPMTRPYLEEYRPAPFSREHVRHLPGWYAQKHPDEDWAETFAVWMTPGFDWKTAYGGWRTVQAKLRYCEQRMAEVGAAPPLVDAIEPDEDVNELTHTLEEIYAETGEHAAPMPEGLDGALGLIFEEREDQKPGEEHLPAAPLIRRLERALMAEVFQWTGHFPERTRALVRHLAVRAKALELTYRPGSEARLTVAMTALVTSLAMNHVHQGTYMP